MHAESCHIKGPQTIQIGKCIRNDTSCGVYKTVERLVWQRRGVKRTKDLCSRQSVVAVASFSPKARLSWAVELSSKKSFVILYSFSCGVEYISKLDVKI